MAKRATKTSPSVPTTTRTATPTEMAPAGTVETTSLQTATKQESKVEKGRKFTLIRASTDKLLALVKKLLVSYAKMHDELHEVACSVTFHAAKHGDTRPLTAFFDGLNTNYQTAFRFWIGRAFREFEDCRCLNYSAKEGWSMLPNTTKERAAFARLVEIRMLNPDGKTFMRFYERNIVREVMEYGDKDILNTLKGIVRKAEQHDEKVESKASAGLVLLVKRTLLAAEDYAKAHPLPSAEAGAAGQAVAVQSATTH